MIDWLKRLFSSDGSVSMMRFLSFLCVLTACLIGLKVTVMGGDMSTAAVLCSTFLGFGIGGKVSQKFAEGKTEQTSEVASEKR
jgi:hypothetical protein